ncbi:hypothetical protein GARCT_02035 [Geobacillus sp. 12AMOR1]|nr:hypothetical protein GARCT_02035 [Geobacillus sp. 12AMOR1]
MKALRKANFLLIGIIFMFILAACSGQESNSSTSEGNSNSNEEQKNLKDGSSPKDVLDF